MSTASPILFAGAAAKDHLVLWSTNPKIKHYIQQAYFGGTHFVWCSPAFDGQSLPRYSIGHSQPPSSDPVSIYRNLHRAVSMGDQLDPKITRMKADMVARAIRQHDEGVITEEMRDEVVAIIESSTLKDWRPLIYVIPFDRVKGRHRLVPRNSRASMEPEYQIVDLLDGEFEIIEPWPI